jgi:hypothetical protein
MAYIADNDHNSALDAALADILDDLAALRAEGRKGSGPLQRRRFTDRFGAPVPG